MNRNDRWTVFRSGCLVVAAGVIVGAGLAWTSASEPARREGGASLFGRVIDADGQAVARAHVRLHQWDSEKGGFTTARAEYTSDNSGSYCLDGLADGHYVLVAAAAGFAQSFRGTPLEANGRLALDIVLRKPVTPIIVLRDDQGQPVAGARLRELRQRGDNGSFVLWQRDRRTFGVTVDSSDKQGRLHLPPVPDGTILSAKIDHHELAPVEVADTAAADGTVATMTMRPGVPLTLQFLPAGDGSTPAELSVELYHEPFDHPSTIRQYAAKIGDDGTVRLAVEAGKYEHLWLKHQDFFITPTFLARTFNDSLRIAQGQNDQLSFRLHRKVHVRGRVIDISTGKPLAGMDVLGEIPNRPNRDLAGVFPATWSHADWGETDQNGEFTLALAAGSARVSFQSQKYIAARDYVELDVAPDGSTVVPDIEVRPMPAIAGTVLDTAGKPVSGVVVRFRGRWLAWTQPVLTNANGHFELQPPWIPIDLETEQRLPEQPIVAFHPHQPLSAAVTLSLNDADSLSNVTLTLEQRDYESVLSDFAGEMPGWQSGDTSDVPDAAERLAKSLRGRPAPELDGAAWINTERPQLSLADFRGRYVLLDFWFIGCGPCHADFPSVKLVHELYKDHGVTVIGVHDNSATPEAVRMHVDEEGLPFPVVVDHPDGRIIARYEVHAAVLGYPSYVLIGPDGNVVHADRTVPGPSLRGNKLEIIRRYAMSRSGREAAAPE